MVEKKLKPEIRFKGYTDDWEQRKLNELGEIITGSTPKTNDATNYGGKFQFVSPADIQGNRYVEKTITTLSEEGFNIGRHIRKGASLFVSIGSTIGKVAQTVKKSTSNQQINALVPNENYDDDFVFTLLETQSVKIKAIASNQAVPIVNKTTFGETDVWVPNTKEEQLQMGDYFKQLDNFITLHQRKYDKLINVKKSMLEKMFPKNGASVPEIRFKGFTDDWEQCKLGELSESFEYGLNAAAMEYDGKNKYIRITDIDDNSRLFLDTNLTSPNIDLSNADNFKLKYGDILFARTGASVGKTYIYKDCDGLVYYAGFLIRARIKKEIDPEFVFYNTLTKEYDRYIRITSQRSGQPGVNAQEYAEYEVKVPNYEEQIKIGTFLRHLDNLITLHQYKVEKLKNIKKSMLEKMFL